MDNAVAVMRVSSERQGISGDSIGHQKDQIDLYAKSHNIYIKKYFIFIESASKEQQPVQEAIDYCKNPKNKIQLFIIKSIDRFTRGGSSPYDHMKTQLSKHNVRLVDIYGVINNQNVNTLEHLGVKYSWSVYNPSKKSELLEAERGKDEIRDIMSRMIGTEIRYTRLGYRVRGAPIGYQNEQIETKNGKRYILAPHPIESIWIKRMFELKAQKQLSDQQIVDHVNLMGFKTRRCYLRDPKDKNKIIGLKGENKLDIRALDRILKKTLYAGVTIEVWTFNKPVRLKSPGLVSIDTYNKANAGKVMITEGDELEFIKGEQIRKRLVSTSISLRYPYKRLVYCSNCNHPYYGSASRGKLGKHYPAYHCSKKGHNERIPLKKLHDAVVDYLNQIRIKDEFIDKIQSFFADNSNNVRQIFIEETDSIEDRLKEISIEMKLIIDRIKAVSSQVAIQSLEDELIAINKEKDALLSKQDSKKSKIEIKVKKRNHVSKDNKLPILLILDHNAEKKAQLFGLLFSQIPTFDNLLNRTALLNPQFKLISE